MGKHTFEGCTFINNTIGVRAPECTELVFKETTFSGNGEAISIYESQKSFLEENFIPGAPLENIHQAAHQLQTVEASEYPSILDKYEISKWLKPATDITTVAVNIVSLFGK
ncbi:hypothetical protein ACTR53_003558 [Escherichia coli]